MKTKVYYQTNKSTCGIAALKSFLYFYSKGKIDDIEEDVFHKDYSLLELKNIASKYGIITEGIELLNKDIANIPKYSIVILNNYNSLHYVFYLYTKKEVHIIDPNIGKMILSIAEFLSMLSPYILIYKNKNFIYEYKKNKKKNCILLTLEIIQSLPLILLFISFSSDGYISFSLLIIYWFIYFIKRIILLLMMKRFDNVIEDKIKNNDIKDINMIKNIYLYKKHHFSYISNIYNFILVKFIFIIFTLLLPYGFILTIGYLLTLFIDYLSYRALNKSIYKINNNQILKKDNYDKYKILNGLTNNYAIKKEIFKVISIFTFLIVVIIYSLNININISLITGIIVTSLYLISNNDFYLINNEYKEYSIYKTIFNNLK